MVCIGLLQNRRSMTEMRAMKIVCWVLITTGMLMLLVGFIGVMIALYQMVTT